MTKKTRKVKMDVPEDSVVIVFNCDELFMVKKIVEYFIWRDDDVWAAVGIKGKKLEKVLNNKLIEMENILLQNYEGDYVFSQMQEGNICFPYQQIENNL